MSLPSPSIEDLFFAASEHQDAAARSAYLDEACGRDTELRRRLEGLLAVEPKVDQFLESPAVMAASGVNVGSIWLDSQLAELGGVLLRP